MEAERTPLPGIGVAYAFTTGDGDRLGVVCRPAGSRDLTLYQRSDPDAVAATARLTPLEARHVAALLQPVGTVDLSAMPADPGDAPAVARLPVVAGSPLDGRELAACPGGVAVVALLRGADVIRCPQPADILRHGDALVVVGPPVAITRLGRVAAGDLDH